MTEQPHDQTNPDQVAESEDIPKPLTWRERIKGGLIVAGVFVFVPLGVLMMIWSDTCEQRVLIDNIVSPSERFRAQYVVTECGESMNPASEIMVSVRKEGGVWTDTTTVLLYPGVVQPDLQWQQGDLLEIRVPDDTEIIKRRVTWREASIELKKQPSAKKPSDQSPNNEG